MQKSLAIALAAVFVAVALPTTQAETITAEYDIPSGASNATCGNPACAVSTSVGSSDWDDEWWCVEDNDPELGNACENTIDPIAGTVFPAARSALGRGDDGIVNMGIFGLVSDCGDCYTDFQVTITDTIPANTLFSFCIITDHQDGREDADGDNFCGDVDPRDPGMQPDDIADPRFEGCGSGSVSSPVAAGGPVNGATGFVFATHVDSTTGGVCLGSKGSMTVEMS